MIDKIIVSEANIPEISEVLDRGLQAYNVQFLGKKITQNFIVYMKEKGNVTGGIEGKLVRNVAMVDTVWVHENYRKLGIGSALFSKLDIYSKTKNIKHIMLDTYDFQARPFYEKLGFNCIGTVKQWLEGRDCHFMRKDL